MAHHAERLASAPPRPQITSPFILNASYAYIDNKDLVLALRMMPGGDLAHYVKLSKKKKDGKDPVVAGLGKAVVQFYIASTGARAPTRTLSSFTSASAAHRCTRYGRRCPSKAPAPLPQALPHPPGGSTTPQHKTRAYHTNRTATLEIHI